MGQNFDVADTLANIAFFVLDSRGQTENPTHAQVTAAVVRSADLLDLYAEPNAPKIYIAAVNQLAARHNWKIGAPVVVNGFDHKAGKTIPARQGDVAGR